MTRVVTVAGGCFAPGHLGELTQIVPFEMVDAALAETRRMQQRLRVLPSRVVVYLLLAAGLFTEVGLSQVWTRLCAGLDKLAVARPSPSALAAARVRVGAVPLRALFDLLRGAETGCVQVGTARASRPGVFWRGRLVTAVDGTILCCPDTPANLTQFSKGGGHNGGTGYPMVRVLALVACGTRTIIDAVFGTDRTGEIGYAHQLLRSTRTGMIVLADRNFAAAAWIAALSQTGADMLVRVKNHRRLPVCRALPDGSFVSRIGRVEVRVITAQVTITTSDGRRTETYRLITTVLDTAVPAVEIVELYHQRWEIETAFAELKATSMGGRVLRSRTPAGVTQEIYALLITYQALRIAISDTTLDRADIDPDRGSFTVALHAARDQLIAAAGVIADTAIDLVGAIGRHILDQLLPARRIRTNPRVVKRAISKYVASTAKGRHRGPSHPTTITIEIEATLTTQPPA
ncbi:transposase IS4 family protein [Amycolatopsis mediterranei S699]|uniref:Transposase IS4 family protein n=2 Tax=Amycolatopsis mediterranei TaxID=33910 RepID=A0A0H3DHY0_AMYMU|nr:IS4 family transposase [Amycolatopsis mediterranei]ADJ49259.1 transposase IS4 family protein [Amycolatopsis mediterranei U32]AEK46222.1 transposase IS4 family protein [Amycolatopsis mediterranei S699]AFO80967.1 transposase IS4 family protein [Amycolatopsis mediterranei S699]AGT88095.1 transposase IS4 family protein [Amycolatopsis mediterranei RB]KDO04240.1 transposase [Amycolatopsis mediterranei]